MIDNIIVVISFILETALLMGLLLKFFGAKESIRHPVLWSAVFGVVVTIALTIRQFTGEWFAFAGYLLILVIFALSYSLVVIKGKFYYKLTTIIVYLCSLVTIQILTSELLRFVLDLIGPQNYSAGMFIISKSLLAVAAFFISKYNIKTQYDLPISYWSILIVIPLLNFISLLLLMEVMMTQWEIPVFNMYIF